MAIVQNPIIGRTKGQVGGLVFTSSRGKNIVRAKPAAVAASATPRQVAQRNAMRTVVALFRLLSNVVNIGFRSFVSTVSQYNKFTSLCLRNCFNFSNLEHVVIDWSKLSIAQGTISNTVVVADFSDLESTTLTWPTDALQAGQKDSDVLCYAIVFDDMSASFGAVTTVSRETGSIVIPINEAQASAGNSYIFAYFAAVTGNATSDSVLCEEA